MPPGPGLRIVQAISLWLFFRALVKVAARYLLGYRQTFQLTTQSKQLLLNRERIIWGRAIRKECSVLPLEGLQEVTLEKNGESPAFFAGLTALALGSFFSFQFLVQAFRVPGSAWSLFGAAALMMAAGVALDFFLGSGRTLRSFNGPTQLVLKVEGSRGWVLSKLTAEEAQATLDWAEQALTSRQAADC